MSKVIIVGGGAAGMFAGMFAARNGNQVILFEKNERLGKKLFITGKGRCNITNAADMDELFASVTRNEKFLYSAFYGYTNTDTMEEFRSLGLDLKIERGNRVFPVSDHSSDVIKVLRKELEALGVEIRLNTMVKELVIAEGKVKGVLLEQGKRVEGDAVIVATGGLSYPSTGSTGDGMKWAMEAGHKVTDTCPCLVPFEIKENYVKELQGLSLKNVEIRLLESGKDKYKGFGEMLFTHYGVSGPLILSGSSYVVPLKQNKKYEIVLDLKPALSIEQLDARILRDFKENQNKQFKNVIQGLFPSKLVPVMIALSGIGENKQINAVSREERLSFVHLIKNLPMTITGTRDYKEAIITRGGISVKEVNPSTMESKKVKNLYFIGEVLDLDALTGGFNLQIAWSCGYAAGSQIF